jgi:hypothetical protein
MTRKSRLPNFVLGGKGGGVMGRGQFLPTRPASFTEIDGNSSRLDSVMQWNHLHFIDVAARPHTDQ